MRPASLAGSFLSSPVRFVVLSVFGKEDAQQRSSAEPTRFERNSGRLNTKITPRTYVANRGVWRVKYTDKISGCDGIKEVHRGQREELRRRARDQMEQRRRYEL